MTRQPFLTRLAARLGWSRCGGCLRLYRGSMDAHYEGPRHAMEA